MLLSTTVVLLACLAPMAQVSDPASLLPADSLIYFGTNSVRAGGDASRGTAMAKILGEAEVRAFLHKPTAAAEGVLKAMLSTAPQLQKVAEEKGIDLDVSLDFSTHTDSLPVGQAFVAVTHVSLAGAAGPDVGLVLGVELLNGDHVAMLKGLWGSIPTDEMKGMHEGLEYLSKSIPETPNSVHLAFLGKLAVLALSEDVLHGMLDRFHHRDSATASLADAADYRKLLKASHGLPVGASANIVRVGALMDVVRVGLGMALAAEMSPEELGMVMDVVSRLGLKDVHMVGGVSSVGSDGFVHTTSMSSVDPLSTGLLPGLMMGGEGVDVALFEEIPAESLSAAAMAIGDQLVSVYDFAMNVLGTLAPEKKGEVDGLISAALGGASLRDDILGNFQGAFVNFALPGEGFPGTPESVAKFGLRDPDAFVTALGSLVVFVGQQAGMPIKVKESDFEGRTIHEIDLSGTPVGVMMQPAFAIDEGQLVFSNVTRRLKSHLTSDGVNGPSLGEDAGITQFISGIGAEGGLQRITYSDNAANFKTNYGLMAGSLPMVAAMAGEIPVDFSKLPPEQAIGQHLSPTFSAAFSDGQGTLVSHTKSQFQMMDFLPVILIGGILGAGQSQGITAQAGEAETVNPAEQAISDLRELRASCTVYKFAEGAYPEVLDELLRSLPDYENGVFARDEIPLDPWGNSYHFAMANHPTRNKLLPKLWSSGPNGIDEDGEGDDVLKF
jgi:hypothetical protein